MLYTVECSYTDRTSEAEWNDFYSDQKLPSLISVSGFLTSQRFRALKSKRPVYLAVHTIKALSVLLSDEYCLKGGGHFARWQMHLTDWYRNVYEYEGIAPSVSPNQILVLSRHPVPDIEFIPGIRGMSMLASGLDKHPQTRVLYCVPRAMQAQLADVPETVLYEPLTMQLQAAS